MIERQERLRFHVVHMQTVRWDSMMQAVETSRMLGSWVQGCTMNTGGATPPFDGRVTIARLYTRGNMRHSGRVATLCEAKRSVRETA